MKKNQLVSALVTAAVICSGCGQVDQVGKMSEADNGTNAAAEVSEDHSEGSTGKSYGRTENSGSAVTDPGSESSSDPADEEVSTSDSETDDPESPTDSEDNNGGSSSTVTTQPAASNTEITYAPPPPVYDIDGLTYIGGMLIANKTYSLPSDYAPGLEDICYSQFLLLSNAAAEQGLNIWLASGYRSWDYQNTIYNNYVSIYGQESADTFSARPGHSEHQTGLAIDVNTIDDSFGYTAESDWLAAHAHEYGFIIRYPKGKEDITGYKYEPWHIRYVGTDLACAIYNSGLTVEEYFGIDSCYN